MPNQVQKTVINAEDAETMQKITNNEKIHEIRNTAFMSFSKKEQIDYLNKMYANNSQIIKQNKLKTINEEGDING